MSERERAREFMAKWVAGHYVVKAHSGPMQDMPTGDVENMLAAAIIHVHQRGFDEAKEMAAQELARQADKMRDECSREVMGVAWDVIPGWCKAIRALESKP